MDLEAMQAGAFDYVTKSELSPPLLERVIRYAKERQRIEASLEARVEQRTEELQSALEELQVMEEELRTQLDESLRSGADRNASNERYRDLFESAPSPYFVTDPLGIILTPNRAAVRLFERDVEFLVGKPLSVFIAEDDRPAFRSFINRLPQTKGVQELNLRMQPHPNETVDVQMLVSPVRGADGQVITIRWLVYVKKPA